MGAAVADGGLSPPRHGKLSATQGQAFLSSSSCCERQRWPALQLIGRGSAPPQAPFLFPSFNSSRRAVMDGAAAGPLAGARVRLRAGAPPSSGLAVVLESEPSRRQGNTEQWLGPIFRATASRCLWWLSCMATADGSPHGETLVSLRHLYCLARVRVCLYFVDSKSISFSLVLSCLFFRFVTEYSFPIQSTL